MTHCLTSDSVLGEAGFSVRATSLDPNDPLLSIVMNLNSYELASLAFDGAQPYPKEAPIRLAAIPLKDNPFVAIMHSVFMEYDTRGRPNSYFTHVVFVPKDEFSWRTVLKSWGLIYWELDDLSENLDNAFTPPRWIAQWPIHATKILPVLKSLPGPKCDDNFFESELADYYLKSPSEFQTVLGGSLIRLKNKAKQKKGDEPVRGFLFPRFKSKGNQCEGGDGDDFWSKKRPFKFSENIQKTLLQFLFIAWFFPENLLKNMGFSTYEPHKYGVSVANDKLLVGVVHAYGEMPDSIITSQGVEYFPNLLSVDEKDKVFDWSKKQVDRIFKNREITLFEFSNKFEKIYKSVETSICKWAVFEEAKKLFDIIDSYECNPVFDTSFPLLRIAKTNSLARNVFYKKNVDALPSFVNHCYEKASIIENPSIIEALLFLFDPKYFDEIKVCNYLTSVVFFESEDNMSRENDKLGFLDKIIDLQKRDLKFVNIPKSNLIEGIEKLFFCKKYEHWKRNPKAVSQLFDFFFKNDFKKTSEKIVLTADYDTVADFFCTRFIDNFKSDEWFLILPCLIEYSLKIKKISNRFSDHYTKGNFLCVLNQLIDQKAIPAWKDFFKLYKKGSGKECLTLVTTLVNSGTIIRESLLLEFLLTERELLSKVQVQQFLFSGNALILKIISAIGWPEWLINLVNDYLLQLDIILMFKTNLKSTGSEQLQDSLVNVFLGLGELCSKINCEVPSSHKVKSIIEAIVEINRYAIDMPKKFEKEKFEKNVEILSIYFKNTIKIDFKKQVIEYLASVVKNQADKTGGYFKKEGEFLLLLVCLNSRYPSGNFNDLRSKGIFDYRIHNKLLPECISKTNDDLANLLFSGYQNGWIQNFIPETDQNVDDIRNKLANLFREKYLFGANICLFIGKLITPLIFPPKHDSNKDKYSLGRFVLMTFFLLSFFVLFLSSNNFLNESLIDNNSLTATEFINFNIFGLMCLIWSYCAIFSKANNLAKSNSLGENEIFYMKIWLILWVVGAMLLSVFFLFQHSFSLSFIFVLLIEIVWFGLYCFIKKDPVVLYLSNPSITGEINDI